MTRASLRVAVVLTLLGGVLGVSTSPALAWTDVPSNFWAKTAIDHVAVTNKWMEDFGTETFKPEAIETKRRFASALVKAFDPNGTVDPTITFPDMPATDPFYRYANIAVKHGWMTVTADGKFKPANGVNTIATHRGLVLALGLQEEVDGLNAIHTDDGTSIAVDTVRFAYMILGMQLGFRYNHADETQEVMPGTVLHRDEVAYSLWKAKTAAQWQLDKLIPYRDISLPVQAASKLAVAEFGFKYVGYPYIWAGEWYKKSPSGYCCGSQPKGGFDCSGLMWWALKKPGGGYDPRPVRGYWGWSLPQRSSATMAAVGTRLTYAQTLPGDLMFHDSGSNPGVISHVNVYLGNGWALDSSSSAAGVSVIKVDSGYYYDHHMWSRRLSA